MIDQWLLDSDVEARINNAIAAGYEPDAQAVARVELASADLGKLRVDGRRATIRIDGVLTQKRDVLAMIFGDGNTLYPDIITATRAAEASVDVDGIDYVFGASPGGGVFGMFDVMDAIRDASKPTRAIVEHAALSAAYSLASQTDEIVAMSRATVVGSVGVKIRRWVGSDEVTITNTASPNKDPDVSTEEGQAAVRAELDSVYQILAADIAAGRKKTVAQIDADFGKGATVLAEDALRVGMIDAIGVQSEDKTQSAASGKNKKGSKMDLKTLMAEHPDVYAAAVASEKDRVCAHLTLGESSGDMATAISAIRDGSEMTQTLMATYTAAAMKRDVQGQRVNDNPPDVGAPPAPSVDSFGDRVLEAYEGGYASAEVDDYALYGEGE